MMKIEFDSVSHLGGKIIGPIGRASSNKLLAWVVQCRCGRTRMVNATKITEVYDRVLCKECRRIRNNGVSGRYCWAGMIARCRNPKNKEYSAYGGSGVCVVDRWISGDGTISGFECFLLDMGPRPSRRHSIHRIGNAKIYGPDTCKWSDDIEQQNNRTNNRYITAGGITMSMSDWSRRMGCSPSVLKSRIYKYGWDQEKAVMTPVVTRARKGQRSPTTT